MAITKIQAGALPADVITTAAIDDASITHAKLHTTMDLSSKTVTLPSAITDTITNKLPLAGGTVTGNVTVNSAGVGDNGLFVGPTGYTGSFVYKSSGDAEIAPRSGKDLIFADSTGGTGLVRIKSNGNVGIGVTNPSAALDVVSNSASGYVAEFRESNASNFGTIVIDSPSDGSSRPSYMDYATGGTVKWSTGLAYNDTTRAFHIGTGSGLSNSKVTIATNGNVGIGTTSPSTMLHLSAGTTGSQGGSHAGITMTNKYDNPDNSWSIRPSRDGLSNTGLEIRDVTDNRSVMAFDGAGNVGIGTNSPDAPLDVTRVGDGTIAIFQNTGLHGFEFSAPSSTALQIASRQGSKNLDLWANTLSFSAGGSQRMAIDSSGRVTKPQQPCFGAILGSHIYTSNYLTGWTAQTNVGSHFNAGDGTFTAPVTGQYYFYVSVMRATNDSGDYSVQIRKNGSTVRLSNDMVNGSYVTYMQTTVPAVLTLAAGDNIRFYIGNTVTTSYAYQGTYTHCGGYLIG